MIEDIKHQIFKETGEKLDSYSLAIIRAGLIANEKVIDSNKTLLERINNSIKPQVYHLNGLSSWQLLQFRWGWSWAVLFGLIILIGAYLYRTEPKTVIPQELSVIEKRGNKLFISADHYQVSRTEKGIYIKLKDNN
jgi:hypothetical protein